MPGKNDNIEPIPVLVVGGGPVGLALAGDLGWRGQRCLLIEQSDGAVVQPKMCLVGVRTMEFCRRWGIAMAVQEAPYPLDYPQDYIYVTALNGYELARERFPTRRNEPIPPQSPQKRERCPQHLFDPILARFAGALPGVELRYRTKLVALAADGDAVRATVKDCAGGELRMIVAQYVVGADGAASTVRKLAGIAMSGDPVLTYTTHVLLRSAELPRLHDKGNGYRFVFIGPEGTWLTITSINGDDLWRMQMIGDTSRSIPDADAIDAALRRAVGCDFAYEIVDVMPWVRRELVADAYARGRVFIAGDAAHLMSPTGAFGMNTGIGDAVDLAWKLDAMLAGWGGPHLLASYEAERRPVAIRNMQEASGNLRRTLSTRGRRPPENLFAPGPTADAARREYGAWYAGIMQREWFTIGINLGYRYDSSPIICPDGTPQPPDEVSTYAQTGRPGARAPHVWLADGRSTLDLFGRGYVLLRLGADPPLADAFVQAASERGVPLAVIRLNAADVHTAYQRRLVLVRPDGHVAWRGDDLPADAGAVLDVARGSAVGRGATDPRMSEQALALS